MILLLKYCFPIAVPASACVASAAATVRLPYLFALWFGFFSRKFVNLVFFFGFQEVDYYLQYHADRLHCKISD
jgi:hypothetical protein